MPSSVGLPHFSEVYGILPQKAHNSLSVRSSPDSPGKVWMRHKQVVMLCVRDPERVCLSRGKRYDSEPQSLGNAKEEDCENQVQRAEQGQNQGQTKAKPRPKTRDSPSLRNWAKQEQTEGDVSVADGASACYYGHTRWRAMVASAGIKAPD